MFYFFKTIFLYLNNISCLFLKKILARKKNILNNIFVGSVSEYKSFYSEYEYTRWVCVVVAPDINKVKSKILNISHFF